MKIPGFYLNCSLKQFDSYYLGLACNLSLHILNIHATPKCKKKRKLEYNLQDSKIPKKSNNNCYPLQNAILIILYNILSRSHSKSYIQFLSCFFVVVVFDICIYFFISMFFNEFIRRVAFCIILHRKL